MASAELAQLVDELSVMGEPPSLAAERAEWDRVCTPLTALAEVAVQTVDAHGVGATWFMPPAPTQRTILYCHGGAFALGSPWHNRGMLSRLALATRAPVFAVDYRLAPEHPFPAAVDDVRAGCHWLLDSGIPPGELVLAGDSCGANLCLGAALWMRDQDLRAAAIACLSPWSDLTMPGESFATNAALDTFVTRESLVGLANAYLSGVSAEDPLASPIFADLAGLPRMLIQVGANEALLSDARALAQRAAAAGVPVTIEVEPEVIHVWQMWAGRVPESDAAISRMAAFISAA